LGFKLVVLVGAGFPLSQGIETQLGNTPASGNSRLARQLLSRKLGHCHLSIYIGVLDEQVRFVWSARNWPSPPWTRPCMAAVYSALAPMFAWKVPKQLATPTCPLLAATQIPPNHV